MGFFKLNVLNVSLWCLIGVLLCVLVGVLVWRLTKGKRTGEEKVKLNPIKSTSFTAQIALGMNLTFGYRTLSNILFKNKYSKAGFSLMPVVVERNNMIFLIGNLLNGTTSELRVGTRNGKVGVWQKTRKGEVSAIDWSFAYFNEWERFIRGLDESIIVKKIIPCVGSVGVEAKDATIHFVQVEDIGSKIKSLAGEVLEENSNVGSKKVDRLFEVLGDLNMFTKKGQVPRGLTKRLME